MATIDNCRHHLPPEVCVYCRSPSAPPANPASGKVERVGEDAPGILTRLHERARAARDEETATALGDALHFEEAAHRIDDLQTALIAIRRRTIFGPSITTSDLLDLTADVAGLTSDQPTQPSDKALVSQETLERLITEVDRMFTPPFRHSEETLYDALAALRSEMEDGKP